MLFGQCEIGIYPKFSNAIFCLFLHAQLHMHTFLHFQTERREKNKKRLKKEERLNIFKKLLVFKLISLLILWGGETGKLNKVDSQF